MNDINSQMQTPGNDFYVNQQQQSSVPGQSPQNAPEEPKKHKKNRAKAVLKRIWLPVVIVLVLLVLGGLTYGYISTKNQLTQAKKQDTVGKSEIDQIVSQVGKVLTLPDETPTLATVSDVDKLKQQQFFKNAQNGDKVLVFPKAGRALLYRPSTHKVIEYSLVNLNVTNNNP